MLMRYMYKKLFVTATKEHPSRQDLYTLDLQSGALERVSKRIYRMLSLEGYARIDYRLSEDGKLYFLEANPNPELANYEELAHAAAKAGITITDEEVDAAVASIACGSMSNTYTRAAPSSAAAMPRMPEPQP